MIRGRGKAEPANVACPCCGYRTLHEGPGMYDLCPVCWWEDDGAPDDAESLEGPNGMTLAEGQRWFQRYGASSPYALDEVRSPTAAEARDPDWRPLPAALVDDRDRFLPDLGEMLKAKVDLASRRAAGRRGGPRRTAPGRVARYEGLREAYAMFVAQVDRFGVSREEAGIDPDFDAERDLRLVRRRGTYVIVASDHAPPPAGLVRPPDDQR